MVKLICWRCGHEWDYEGKSDNPRCPKCKKMFTKSKFIAEMKQRDIEPNQHETPEKQVNEDEINGITSESSSSKGEVKQGESSVIKVEQVDIEPPPELDQPELAKKVQEGQEATAKKKPVVADIPIQTIEMFIKTPFEWWAKAEDDMRLALQKKEVDSLSPMAKRILDKHLPAWLANYADEVAFALVAITVVGSRAMISHKNRQKKKKKEAAKISAPPKKPEEQIAFGAETQVGQAVESEGEFVPAWDVGAAQQKQRGGGKNARRK